MVIDENARKGNTFVFSFFSVAGEISLQVNAVASLWKRERPVSNTTTHESHFAL